MYALFLQLNNIKTLFTSFMKLYMGGAPKIPQNSLSKRDKYLILQYILQ